MGKSGVLSGRVTKLGEKTRNKKNSVTGEKVKKATKPVLAIENKLVDSLRPGLLLVMIGLNPGVMTAQTGHAYAHKSNKYWPLMHESGVTPIRHQPSDTRALMDLYGIGNTNIISRPSRDGSTLSKAEYAEGAAILEAKIRAHRPEAVAIVGKGIWEALWLARTGKKMQPGQFRYGWQDPEARLGRIVTEDGEVEWGGARTYVTTTTSGLAASMSKEEKLDIWKPLGQWFKYRRAEAQWNSNSNAASPQT